MARRRPSPVEGDAEATTVSIGARELTHTRLKKVLYPAAGVTKAEIIDYYVRVAPVLLPHLAQRPVTLKRYPDGVTGEAYWDKDAPSFKPDWVRTVPVPRRAGGKPIHYILIEEPATLAWTANIAAIELHPFLHCAPQLQQPTSVVLDLDPGDGVDLLACIEVALLVRKTLDKLSLQAYPKVSGSKGLQLYIPLNSRVTYSITQPFARTLVRFLAKQRPDCVVAEMAKTKRAGRIFIDWSQNTDYKTTVGVYSLRAKRQRPYVSMPVRWTELERAFKRKTPDTLLFSPQAALERIAQEGDLFEPVLTVRQQLPGQVVESIQAQNLRRYPVSKGLREYSEKRDFSKTSEPPASVPHKSSQGGRRRFVVQKHAATRLHFDLRLEIHGALKSWAVPKGPPLEPGLRRLASATEDHPLEYLDFEGIIPPGQYGGGTVMVWDIGVFEIVEGNYWKGRLHIALAGKKLNGE